MFLFDAPLGLANSRARESTGSLRSRAESPQLRRSAPTSFLLQNASSRSRGGSPGFKRAIASSALLYVSGFTVAARIMLPTLTTGDRWEKTPTVEKNFADNSASSSNDSGKLRYDFRNTYVYSDIRRRQPDPKT